MAPPAPPASGAQHQFLDTALPYADDVKWLVPDHLATLAEAFPSLRPRTALFTHDDGRAARLLQAAGTIPIVHAGASCDLPAVVWLPERYPRCPPLVFLSPARGTVLRTDHPLVDRSGLVAAADASYLRSWAFPSSNLRDLVRSLSHAFGIDPPLLPTDVAYRRDALAGMACADVAALRAASEAEMDALFAVQAELRGRGRAADGLVRRAGEEVDALERRLQDVTVAAYALEAWVAANRTTVAAGHDAQAGAAVQPADALSAQRLECAAMDLALEDSMYALDEAVQGGAVPFSGYLRSVRALAREQFFQRALWAKLC
ncbi:hypothetical protein ACQJBY_046537 [Aegilops geniculata]